MSDIFIAYAHEDRPRAKVLAETLSTTGWSVFWDRTIPAGLSWWTFVGRELEEARCIVVAWSEVSIRSDWVREEADDGKNRGILIPVFFDPVKAPVGFRAIQGVDFAGWRGSAAAGEFRQLVSAAKRILGSTPKEVAEQRREAEEEQKRRAEADAVRKAEEEQKRRADANAARKAEEEQKRRADTEAARKAEDEHNRRSGAEAARKANEHRRQRAAKTPPRARRTFRKRAALRVLQLVVLAAVATLIFVGVGHLPLRTPPPAPHPDDACSEARETWTRIASSTSLADLQAFISTYGSCDPASLARKRHAEIVEWAAVDRNDLEALRAYVKRYPSGAFAEEAAAQYLELTRGHAEREKQRAQEAMGRITGGTRRGEGYQRASRILQEGIALLGAADYQDAAARFVEAKEAADQVARLVREETPPPPAENGRLELLIVPWAEVSVDNQTIGQTPLRPIELSPGKHSVVLNHPAFEPLEKTVLIRPGEETLLEVDLSSGAVPR